MRPKKLLLLLFAVTACLPLLAACSGGEDGGLKVTWRAVAGQPGAVLPSQTFATNVYIQNNGVAIEGVELRFDQMAGGSMPLGISVGTATNLSSRFEGNTQVWDLGRIEAGQTVVFPVTLWFESTSPTIETRNISLYVQVAGPGLETAVLSNALEVEVDTRVAVTN